MKEGKFLFTRRRELCYTIVSEKYEYPAQWAGGKVEYPMDLTEKTLSRREIYDGRIVHLHVDEVELPDYLREEAGIPEKAKLCASVDEDEHTVTISEADYDYDLRDVPEEVLEMFRDAEICVGELEERLILGDVVYGD